MFLSEDVDQIDFDISILSKIEHQEGLINHNMLWRISEMFNIEFKELQINYISKKIAMELGLPTLID